MWELNRDGRQLVPSDAKACPYCKVICEVYCAAVTIQSRKEPVLFVLWPKECCRKWLGLVILFFGYTRPHNVPTTIGGNKCLVSTRCPVVNVHLVCCTSSGICVPVDVECHQRVLIYIHVLLIVPPTYLSAVITTISQSDTRRSQTVFPPASSTVQLDLCPVYAAYENTVFVLSAVID